MKNSFKSIFKSFSRFEIALLLSSISLIVFSFLLFDRQNYLSLIASLVGVFSLIFCAKGNPIGEGLMVLFSILYAIISFGYSYYGEMITYLGMTLPMSIFALVSWIKNPYKKGEYEVRVKNLRRVEFYIMIALAILVTAAFYFILKYWNTSNLIVSTFSVTTSFIAAYLCLMRNVYFTVAYAVNDMVLIVLWILATVENISYISVTICFVVFLANDLYGFYNWQKMKNKQNLES
jgi:nicotinamide mononucleotide transporter PnuC